MNTGKAIGWIASDYGFSDASHFTRLFHKYYGVTPAAAREMRGQESAVQTRQRPRSQQCTKTALDEILWSDPLSFAAIDWPPERRERAALAVDRSHKRVPDRKRPNRSR